MTVYDDRASSYIIDLFAREDQSLKEAVEGTARHNMPLINIKPEEGKFLQLLALASGGKRVLEIGTLGGYSGIWIARGLPPEGKLITLELSEEHAGVARQNFENAGVDEWVEIRVGNAHDLVRELSSEDPFDMVFIDAEKGGYEDYYEWAVNHVRRGGIIAIHNAFRKGSVFGKVDKDEHTDTMIEFNRKVADDLRVLATIFPAGDGTIVAVVK